MLCLTHVGPQIGDEGRREHETALDQGGSKAKKMAVARAQTIEDGPKEGSHTAAQSKAKSDESSSRIGRSEKKTDEIRFSV